VRGGQAGENDDRDRVTRQPAPEPSGGRRVFDRTGDERAVARRAPIGRDGDERALRAGRRSAAGGAIEPLVELRAPQRNSLVPSPAPSGRGGS
jgi:hypothetical protein